MNKLTRISYLASLALLLLTSGCATNQRVTVTSEPSGAEVIVRNNYGTMWHWGNTPISKHVRLVGNESVWVDVDLQGYSKQSKTVSIGTSQLHFTLIPFRQKEFFQQQQQQQQTVVIPGLGTGAATPQYGIVGIVADQEDAEVYVDGIFSGNSPANLRLSEGIHIIEVKKSGYQDYRRELRVSGASKLTLRVKLKQ